MLARNASEVSDLTATSNEIKSLGCHVSISSKNQKCSEPAPRDVGEGRVWEVFRRSHQGGAAFGRQDASGVWMTESCLIDENTRLIRRIRSKKAVFVAETRTYSTARWGWLRIAGLQEGGDGIISRIFSLLLFYQWIHWVRIPLFR